MSNTNTIAFDVTIITDLFDFDQDRLQLARERQCALWEGRTPDKWPCVISGELTDAQKVMPVYNYKEEFEDKERMLINQVQSAIAMGQSNSDGVPSLRVNFGTGVLLSCFGLEQEIFDDKMPWLLTHLSKEEASKLDPDNFKPDGSFARGLEIMHYYKEILGDAIPIFAMDTQGPFDLAHLLIGDDLFYQMYDDPEYVHHIMEVCLDATIKAYVLMKEINGEAPNHHTHSNHVYAENMGLRICEDTTAIVSPDNMHTFAIPYTARLAERFGGAWVHYCGRQDDLTKGILDIPHIRAINFGHVPGHMHDQPFEEMLELINAKGKVYQGGWPRFEGESAEDYINRLYTWASKGALLPDLNPVLESDEFNSKTDVLDYWYGLQT